MPEPILSLITSLYCTVVPMHYYILYLASSHLYIALWSQCIIIINVSPLKLCTSLVVSPEWNKFIQSYLSNWLARIKNWILVPSSGHQVLVVKYESLKRDSLTEIERMMTFLRLPFDRETVAKRLAEDFTEFKRPHSKEKDFKRYTDEQILLIRNTVAKAIQLTESTNMTHVLDLNEYMQVFD